MFRRLVRILLLIVGFWLGALALLQVMGELDRQDRAVTVTAWLLDEQAAAKIRRQNEAFDPERPVVRLNPPVDGVSFAELQIGFVDPEDLTSPMPVQFDPDAPQTVIVDDPRAYWANPIAFGIPAVVLLLIGLVLLRPRAARLPSPPPLRRVGRPTGRTAAPMGAPQAASPPAAAVAATVARARSVVEHVSRRDTGTRAVIDGPIVARTVRRPTTLAPLLAVLVLLAGLGAIVYLAWAPGGP
jgi:hypothetical protein